MLESFQNRSQTKSKALFIIIFIVIGSFLIFKLTQDGSKYASPFGAPNKEDIHVQEKTQNNTNENSESEKLKNDEKTKGLGILKTLLGKLENFNSTIEKFDEKFKNFTNLANDFLENNTLNETFVDFLKNSPWGDYENVKDDLQNNLNLLKESFEKVTNSSSGN